MVDWKREIENLEGWTFGDSAEMADELAKKTAQGENLANCFLWSKDGPMPKVGDRSYVKSSKGHPVCVIEVKEIHTLPFGEVNEAFAKAEGYETLEEWRAVHREFFGRRHALFNDDCVVVCQFFELIHVF